MDNQTTRQKTQEALFLAKEKNEHRRETVERDTKPSLLKQKVPLRAQMMKINNILTTINTYISIIALNINWLNSLFKRHWLNV